MECQYYENDTAIFQAPETKKSKFDFCWENDENTVSKGKGGFKIKHGDVESGHRKPILQI